MRINLASRVPSQIRMPCVSEKSEQVQSIGGLKGNERVPEYGGEEGEMGGWE